MSLVGRSLLIAIILLSAPVARAGSFTATFEGDLSAWNQRFTDVQGVIVANPVIDSVDSSAHALAFTGFASGGDLFTKSPITWSGTLHLSLDFLGTCGLNCDSGYIGLSAVTVSTSGLAADNTGTPGAEQWLGGSNGFPTVLVGDGAWHHYDIVATSNIGNTAYLKVEQSGSTSPEVAYFDNIVVSNTSVTVSDAEITNVPEPGSAVIMVPALAVMRRVKRGRARR